jgi:hypothetical protein
VDFSEVGRIWFERHARHPLPPPSKHRARARLCLDWTERRNHLGGHLGAKLTEMMLDRGYLIRGSKRRTMTVTSTGMRFFCDELGIEAGASA